MLDFDAVLANIHATPSPPGMPHQTASKWLDAALETGAMHLRDLSTFYDDPELPCLLENLCHRRPAPASATLIHGDFTPDNVLIAGGQITGIID